MSLFNHLTLLLFYSIPPIPASIMGLIFVFMAAKKRFQAEFWSEVQGFFRIRSEDVKEEARARSAASASSDDSQLLGKKFFLVAELRGRVVGTLAVRESLGSETASGPGAACRLYWLCTHNACRRMGIASKLVGEALQRAKKSGGYAIALATASKNCTSATATLEKVGFNKTDESVIASAYPMSFSVNEYEMHLT